MPPTNSPIQVSTQAELNSAIKQMDSTSAPGDYTIQLTGDIDEGQAGQPAGIDAISLASGVNLTIDGQNNKIDGAGGNGGLAVLQGNVTIQSLTLEDTVAQGGDGSGSGGGGAGLGGGLFVGTGAHVTVDDLTFTGDAAKGGDGGAGGGGGAGGVSSLIAPPLGNTGAPGTPGLSYGGLTGTPGQPGGNGTDGGTGGLGQPGGDGYDWAMSGNRTFTQTA